MSTSAALTSIQALSADDCAEETRRSSCANFSSTALSTDAVVGGEGVVEEAVTAEGARVETGVCFKESGSAAGRRIANIRTSWKQHFHPTRFIGVSAPRMLDSNAGESSNRRNELYAHRRSV